MIAFPIKVARKNFQNGMPNCPHIMPARSNRGFGTWNIISVNSCLQFDKVYIINAILEEDAPQIKEVTTIVDRIYHYEKNLKTGPNSLTGLWWIINLHSYLGAKIYCWDE